MGLLRIVVVVALYFLMAGGLSARIALDLVDLEDARVLDEAVDGSRGHPGIREHVVPAGRQVARV